MAGILQICEYESSLESGLGFLDFHLVGWQLEIELKLDERWYSRFVFCCTGSEILFEDCLAKSECRKVYFTK